VTRVEAVHVETLRYLDACATAATTADPAVAVSARRKAHIHVLALGRLRGQTVAPWIHQSEVTR
jgi:hypothetical protein